jgi:hypothetical protein
MNLWSTPKDDATSNFDDSDKINETGKKYIYLFIFL